MAKKFLVVVEESVRKEFHVEAADYDEARNNALAADRAGVKPVYTSLAGYEVTWVTELPQELT